MTALLIQRGRLFDPASGLDAEGDLLVRGETIAGVGAVETCGDEQVVEAAGLWVLPGLVDLHVHLREPGQEYKETIASGSEAGAAGGFATLVAEPNTAPPRDDPQRIAEMLAIAAERARVRVFQKSCITVGQRGKEVTDMAALRAAGAVAASDDGFSVRKAAIMREALTVAKEAGMPLTLHVDGPQMMARDIELASEADWPVHFSHVSLADEVELIAQAQQRGLRVTGEATPHHLALCADDARRGDPDFKMNPPLRPAGDREALRKALGAGVISVIASDHAPHSVAEKSVAYDKAPFGVIGLETTLGVIWTGLVHAGLLEPAAAVRAMTAAPATVLGMEGPALREGARADITLLDPERQWVVDPSEFRSLARSCPFAGWRLRGKAVGTVAGGRLVLWEGMMMDLGAGP